MKSISSASVNLSVNFFVVGVPGSSFVRKSAFLEALAAAIFLTVCSTLDDFALVNFNGFGTFLLIFELHRCNHNL